MVIIETPIFTERIQELIPDDEYRLLQIHLFNSPDAGRIIPGTGGIRKLRWSAGGHVKKGDIRVIDYWPLPRGAILFLYAYPKNEQDDLTAEQQKQIREIVEGEYL